jgi:hypothetical protein
LHPLPPPDPPKKKPRASAPTPLIIPGIPDFSTLPDTAPEMHHLYTWLLGANDNHCDECISHTGETKTLAEWLRLNLIPPLHPNCGCSLKLYNPPNSGGKEALSMPDLQSEISNQQSSIKEQHQHFEVSAAVTAAGSFEILAITAGVGNGWEFPAETLRASLALWDNAQCFIEHEWSGHSLRNLAGVLHAPAWDETTHGIKSQLKPVGPSAPLLVELGRQLLAEGQPHPNVGFSADVIFNATGKKVTTILRVLSVDLVLNPARGGAFLRALNSTYQPKENPAMPDPTPTPTSPQQTEIERTQQAMQSLLNETARIDALNAQAEAARTVRVQMCAYLLDAGLSASKLPAPSQAAVRKQFTGKVFEASELQAAIDDARELVSSLTAGLTVQGPGRVHGMFDTADKLQAAMDDLMGAPRNPGSEKLSIPRPTGIREMYLNLTGDYDFHGGYYPDRASLATTTDFTGLVKNAMNKVIVDRWAELGRAGYDWWTKIVTVEHFATLNTITGVLVGTVGTLPSVAEGGEYTELAVGDSPETASFTKYGGYIPLTLELIDRDNLSKLKAYPRELASAGIRKLSSLVAAIFSASSGAGPTMADTGALFNATAVTTKGGHANLLTTGLSSAQWEVVSAAVYKQPMLVKQDTGYYGTGPQMAINPRYLLVPRALQLTGRRVLYPDHEYTANYNVENLQKGQPGDVLTVPDWTDADDWAAVVDPAIMPAIYVGERFGILPEIFIAGDNLSPAVFMNDETRLKVRQFAAVWVNDFRPLANNHVN